MLVPGDNPRTPEKIRIMAWANEEIAGLLREYAELTQITGGDVFRARNYEKAARSVRGWADDISQLDATGLRAIPGVGALGPKRALQLNHDLGVQSVDDLAVAIKAGKLDGLAGFGAKSEERIASGIEVYRQGRERVLLDVALHTATTMVAALAAVPGCQRCAYAGSLRRWRETIGDVDILAAAEDSGPLMAAFTAQPEVASVIAGGPTKTSVRMAPGSRSTCGWSRSTPGARRCSTSPVRPRTTWRCARSRCARSSGCPSTGSST